ncbi:MAG: hypothetical protein M3Q06_02335 [Bacteroidota bacterium]|nr:hypothetical protein [Bacteroidota bacterium]
MKLNPFFGTSLLVMVLLLSASCKKEARNVTAEDAVSSASQDAAVTKAGGAKMSNADLLKAVRQATARYHSTTQARNAGYQADNQCVSVPGLGGMGYHWLNPNLVDATFDPLQPEAVLYATGPGGNLRLVALEYIVLNKGQARPMFGDQPLDIGGTPLPIGPHWSLHVWLYEDNPKGMFMPFNPNVTCP